MRKHGDPVADVSADVFLGADPELALVEADMDAWIDAHGCPGHNGQCDCNEDEDCVLHKAEP